MRLARDVASFSFMSLPEEIITARLRLRPMGLDDLEAHHAAVGSDPAVTWDHQAQSREQARAMLEKRVRHWAEHGFGMWSVIEQATGRLIGHGGLQRFEEPAEVELGYYLGRAAWGRGYATELGGAVVRHGFERLRLARIVAVVRPENHASQRVLGKLGFRYAHPAHHYGFDVQYWAQDAPKGLHLPA